MTEHSPEMYKTLRHVCLSAAPSLVEVPAIRNALVEAGWIEKVESNRYTATKLGCAVFRDYVERSSKVDDFRPGWDFQLHTLEHDVTDESGDVVSMYVSKKDLWFSAPENRVTFLGVFAMRVWVRGLLALGEGMHLPPWENFQATTGADGEENSQSRLMDALVEWTLGGTEEGKDYFAYQVEAEREAQRRNNAANLREHKFTGSWGDLCACGITAEHGKGHVYDQWIAHVLEYLEA